MAHCNVPLHPSPTQRLRRITIWDEHELTEEGGNGSDGNEGFINTFFGFLFGYVVMRSFHLSEKQGQGSGVSKCKGSCLSVPGHLSDHLDLCSFCMDKFLIPAFRRLRSYNDKRLIFGG